MAKSKVNQAFHQFSKWETYDIVFVLMDARKTTLREIVDVAQRYGISKDVIEMRRRDYLAHKRFRTTVKAA